MSPTYRAVHDGLQWVLYRNAECKEKKDGQFTGNIVNRESIIGYFPKMEQLADRMYELIIADQIDGKVDQERNGVARACGYARDQVIEFVRSTIDMENKKMKEDE